MGVRAQAAMLKRIAIRVFIVSHIEFDIDVLAYDICELIRQRIQDKPVELTCTIGKSLPQRVVGDPHRIRQVMINLMSNAAKFTSRGTIELHVDMSAQQGRRLLIHTKVSDTGIGIDQGKIEDIFAAFQQADDSTTRKYGGTGLGLSICRKIAHLMDGNVWAESEPGVGSTFHFTAWLNIPDSAHRRQAGTRRAHGAEGFAAQQYLATALLAEDNPVNQTLAEKLLCRAGCNVVVAGNGREAVDLFLAQPEKYDIIFMDIQMPELNGFDATNILRDRGFTRIPIIAITANAMKGDRERCLGAGMDDYIAKPVQKDIVFEMLQKWLPARRPLSDTE